MKSEMGDKYSWLEKNGAAAQDRTGWRTVVFGL